MRWLGALFALALAAPGHVDRPRVWGLGAHVELPLVDPVVAPRYRYLSIRWAALQPTAEVPDPAAIRTRLAARLEGDRRGLPLALRVVSGSDASGGPPPWIPESALADCGPAERQRLVVGWTPDLLEAHARFVAALASALAGTSIAWVEPGSYGLWGEWHVGGDAACTIPEATKVALARPWARHFPGRLSVPVAAAAERSVASVWAAGGAGLRFDCLGYWHDGYAAILVGLGDELARFSGPWGGEFCFAEAGARWSVGLPVPAGVDERLSARAPHVARLSPVARFRRVHAVVEGCGWMYIAGAGAQLVEHRFASGAVGRALDAALGRPRDDARCLAAASRGRLP